jgi:hypothetical protein
MGIVSFPWASGMVFRRTSNLPVRRVLSDEVERLTKLG